MPMNANTENYCKKHEIFAVYFRFVKVKNSILFHFLNAFSPVVCWFPFWRSHLWWRSTARLNNFFIFSCYSANLASHACVCVSFMLLLHCTHAEHSCTKWNRMWPHFFLLLSVKNEERNIGKYIALVRLLVIVNNDSKYDNEPFHHL